VVHGFNQQSHIAAAALESTMARAAPPWRSARTATWPRTSASTTARRSRAAELATAAGDRHDVDIDPNRRRCKERPVDSTNPIERGTSVQPFSSADGGDF